MTQISARLDCVQNLTRQRHDRDQTENQQNAATVDSCFELVGSRQHGVAQQKVEQPARNSCPRLPHFVDSRFGLYHVAVVLSFVRSPALQKFESFNKNLTQTKQSCLLSRNTTHQFLT